MTAGKGPEARGEGRNAPLDVGESAAVGGNPASRQQQPANGDEGGSLPTASSASHSDQCGPLSELSPQLSVDLL